MLAKRVDDLLRLIQPHQALIDEDAGKLIANCAVNECRRDRRIDTTAQAKYHATIAHLFADPRYALVNDRGRVPAWRAAADIQHKVAQDTRTKRCVRYLRVKLNCVIVAAFVTHRGK